MVFHTHSERILAAMGENPDAWYQLMERQSERSWEYPVNCLVCGTKSWSCWSMTDPSQHGWSGMKRDDFAKHRDLTVPFHKKYIDRTNGCERRSGDWSRHRKVMTTLWNGLAEDCDRLSGSSEKLAHQFRNCFLMYHFEFLRSLARLIFGPDAHKLIENDCVGMLPFFSSDPDSC